MGQLRSWWRTCFGYDQARSVVSLSRKTTDLPQDTGVDPNHLFGVNLLHRTGVLYGGLSQATAAGHYPSLAPAAVTICANLVHGDLIDVANIVSSVYIRTRYQSPRSTECFSLRREPPHPINKIDDDSCSTLLFRIHHVDTCLYGIRPVADLGLKSTYGEAITVGEELDIS